MDAADYAAYWRVSVDEAVTILAAQDRVGPLAAQFDTALPAWYAGVWIEHRPFAVVVGHTDWSAATRAGVEQEVETAGIGPYVIYREQNASLSELTALLGSVRRDNDPARVHADLDLPANRVVVEVLHGTRAPLSLSESAVLSNAVEIRELPESIGEFGASAIDIYGGLSSSNCTWGFTVRKKSDTSVTGIMTAGHCANANTYLGISLPYQNGTPDSPVRGSVDAQWSTTPGISDRNWVIDNNQGDTRTITSRRMWANVVVGTTLCKYGRTTHWTCGEVISRTDVPPWITDADAVWLKVGRDGVLMAQGGDSGSPLFIGNTAVGINQGRYFTWAGTADGVFGSIQFQESVLGVTVKTN